MKLYGKLSLVAALVALSACQHAAKPDNNVSSLQDSESDRCNASQYQNFVGKPFSALDNERFTGPVRPIPYNAAVSMDFNFNRLNFFGDRDGKISRVYCG